MMKTLRKHIFNIIERSEDKKGASWVFDVFISSLIALNALAIILESVQSINKEYHEFLYLFEVVSVVIFSIEYALRFWSSVEFPEFERPIYGRIKFMFTSMALVDLLAILPFYLAMLPIDLRFLRILRLFRIFRLFKIVRYTTALQIFTNVFKEKKEQLVVSTVFILFLLLIVSSLMYFI
ncbi:MAG: ion transporter, partial [Bacteroidales bacterium]|nr:ion transporter [Bacteroidales bacterium]